MQYKLRGTPGGRNPPAARDGRAPNSAIEPVRHEAVRDGNEGIFLVSSFAPDIVHRRNA
jgi:hypothetical protein